jgi:hypothetical protein
MKTFVSVLALGLALAFSVPAFASTTSAYVGDMIGGKSAPKSTNSARSAENTALRHHARKQVY